MRNKLDHIIWLTDSYKLSHYKQYPPNTQYVYSYFESRGGVWSETVFYGLQYIIKRYLCGNVGGIESEIDEVADILDLHMSGPVVNRQGWKRLFQKYGGRLPVSIKAVAEGTVVPTHNVLMTIENTDPEFYWITNYLETLLVQAWYPSTVATQSRAMKKVIYQFLDETGDPTGIDFKLHDFGFRGVSSVETAGIGGSGHLLNFKGTDTLAAIAVAMDYYNAEMPGFSIPASEHSTICSWGKKHEIDAFRNMLAQYPEGLVACVSDSFDIYRACREHWGKTLRDEILGRKGTLVVRPDSGEPAKVVVEILDILGDKFGCETNNKGYKVLNPHVRVIQGDGIDRDSLTEILQAMKDARWSADNIAFGSGGGLLQKLNRDTSKYAFKCSQVCVNDNWLDVYKEPITDGGKRSKAGRMKLVKRDGQLQTIINEPENRETNLLQEVFRDGKLLIDQKFEDIVQRATI